MPQHAQPLARRLRNAVQLQAVLLITMALGAPAALAGQGPSGPIDLGTLGGSSYAIGINPAGTLIVGESENRHGQIRPVAWIHRQIVDLATPNAPGEADGLDVNDRDVIVGAYGQTDDPAATQHAFTWHNGTLTILPHLPGGGGTYARRINEHGEIAGDAFTADGHDHPVLWDSDGIHDLGLPPGYTDGFLLAINDNGHAGGAMSSGPDGNLVAFTWHDGRFRILPTLGGPIAQVNVLDDHGVAAGIADVNADGTSEATLWGPSGAAHGLGFFPGGDFSWVLGTNGLGDYTGLGDFSPSDPFSHVFVAHTGGPLLTLKPLHGSYSTTNSGAHGIDRRGDVAGFSNAADGVAHATLWPRAFQQAFAPARSVPDIAPSQ